MFYIHDIDSYNLYMYVLVLQVNLYITLHALIQICPGDLQMIQFTSWWVR